MSTLAIPRHLMATETEIRRGWNAVAWSDSVPAPEAQALAALVPYAGTVENVDDPPWLHGLPAADILTPGNYAKLRLAFARQREWLIFSIWGAAFRPSDSPPWRVMTHSMLLDEAALEAVAGHPEGLLSEDSTSAQPGPAGWLDRFVQQSFDGRSQLEEIRYDPSRRDELERRRLRRLAELGGALADEMRGDGGLAERLGLAYQALALTQGGQQYEHVVFPDDGSGLMRRFAWYVWLSLPERERPGISVQTDERSHRDVRSRLSVLSAAEIRKPEPPSWILFDIEHPPRLDVGRGRKAWAEAVVAGGSDYIRMAGEWKTEGVSLLRDEEAAAWVEWNDWERRRAAEGSIQAVVLGLQIESRRVRHPPRRIERLAAALCDAGASAVRSHDPIRGVDQLITALQNARADAGFLRDVASRAIGLLLEESWAPQDLAVAGLLMFRGAAEGGPWTFSDVSRLLEASYPVVDALRSLRGSAAALLESAGVGYRQGRLDRSLVETRVLDPLFRDHGADLAGLVDRVAEAATSDEAVLSWNLLVLARALDAGLSEREASERFVKTVLPGSARDGSHWAERVRGEPRLLEAVLVPLEAQARLRLLGQVRPTPETVQAVFERITTGPPTSEEAERWAGTLAAAGYPPAALVGAKGLMSEPWLWVLASPHWRSASFDDPEAYRAARKAIMARGPETIRLARHVVDRRLWDETPQLPDAEIELVRRALQALAEGDALPAPPVERLATLPAARHGAAFPWAEACLAHREPKRFERAVALFAQAAVECVRAERGSYRSRWQALRVAWVQYRVAGDESVLRGVAESPDPAATSWLARMLVEEPPLPLYDRLRSHLLQSRDRLARIDDERLRRELWATAPGLALASRPSSRSRRKKSRKRARSGPTATRIRM